METLTLKSGYNITLTEDPANGTLTISATDTKYTIDSTLSGGGGTVTVDSALSGTSTNPVQNKVIYTALQNKQDKINYETWTFTTVSGTIVTKKVYIG